jgi:hypothetical protein
MFDITTRIYVAGLQGREVTDFLARCDDAAYRRWWPGTHLRLHAVDGKPARVGSLVFMDEFIGLRRVHMTGAISELAPGRKLVWQAQWLVRLPVALIIELADDAAGVHVTHTIRVGFAGVLGVLDPLFRLWFTPRFAAAMDEHVRSEFPRLRDLLHPPRAAPAAAG